MPADVFDRSNYLIRRKVFKLMGGAFHVYEGPAMEQVLFYAEQKAFKLKEDFTVYGDEAKTQPLLTIRARSVIDVSATYDVADPATGETVGSCKRKGLKSLLQDEWEVADSAGATIAVAKEDSVFLAMIRRFASNLVPQTFAITTPEGQPLGKLKQHFNPFVFRMDLDFSADASGLLDRRLGLGLAICLTAIEGRQQ